MAQRIHSPAETASTKSKYRVTNWPDYNRALVSHGEVTLWIDEAALPGGRARDGKGKRGWTIGGKIGGDGLGPVMPRWQPLGADGFCLRGHRTHNPLVPAQPPPRR